MSQVFSDDAVSRAMEEIKSNPSSRGHGGAILPHMHKVSGPPKQTLFQDFKHSFNETFFSDDPFAKFKDQTKKRKFVLGLQSVFPILEWGRGYNLKSFKGDLISGLTIASLCIPQVYLFVQMSQSKIYLIRRLCKYYGMSIHSNLIRRLCKCECINRISHMQSLQIWNLSMHYVSNFDILCSSDYIPSSVNIDDKLVLQIQVLLLLLCMLSWEVQEILP